MSAEMTVRAPTAAATPARAPGRIITFYSYKGGTGRSMAVANLAWIMASQGKRVLLIDWDLEAPGLHRYLHPFLQDPELSASPGLIDFFSDFARAACSDEALRPLSDEKPWWTRWTNLLRYTYSLQGWDFPGEGTVDFVPAGQQGAGYAVRATTFDWQAFYDKLGGGVFLEALKSRLRADYDYVLIDSRTGVSDTSGICTVQMPDDLVVCFTLNRQSIRGAAAVAQSASAQRLRPTGEPGLRVWPVPTRVELAEKDRLDLARENARDTFQSHLLHLPRAARASYWGSVEVMYQPYFAYEEVLAVFAERRHQTTSLLSSFQALCGYLTDGQVTALADLPESRRQEGLALFIQTRAPTAAPRRPRRGQVFVSYDKRVEPTAAAIVKYLEERGLDVFWFHKILPGDDWIAAGEQALRESAVVVAVVAPPDFVHENSSFGANDDGNVEANFAQMKGSPNNSEATDLDQGWQYREIQVALEAKKRLIPVMLGSDFHALPRELAKLKALGISPEPTPVELRALADTLQRVLDREAPTTTSPATDPEDPQKGRWGGQSTRNNRTLSAEVTEVAPGWFGFELAVSVRGTPPLSGEVTFHLHSSFPDENVTVRVVAGTASLSLRAWGAFTVGAEMDGGQTTLELDLAEEPRAPQLFRSR